MRKVLPTILIGVPAIVVIGALEAIALYHGINGVALSASVGTIGMIAGFGFGRIGKGSKDAK